MKRNNRGFDAPKHPVLGRTLAYTVFIAWALVTAIPLIWMTYSSFKSNEELTRNIYALPHDLLRNADDVYQVFEPDLNTVVPLKIRQDSREYLAVESTTIAVGRRLMIHFLPVDELPENLARMEPGDTFTVRQLPPGLRRRFNRSTLWFNFISAFVRGELYQKFLNSILYTVVSTFGIIALSLMVGFGVSKFPFRKISAGVAAVIGFGYLISTNSILIPLFLMLSRLGLTNSRIGIILVYIAFGLPMSVMLATGFLKGLPDSLLESAEIDGAGSFRSFLSVVVPMALPVTVTIGILNALGIWNEFLLVLVMSTSEATRSLPVGVFSFSSQTNVQLGWQMAALVIATFPTVVVYWLFSRRITTGVVAGAVKG